MNSHLRDVPSIRSTRAPGSATASGTPGKPAPAPRSAIALASRSSTNSSPASESATWTCHASAGSRTLLCARGSLATAWTTASRAARASGESSSTLDAVSSILKERRDDHAALGLVALAERLDAGAVLQVLVHHAPLGRGHRLELDLVARLEGPLGRAVGLPLDRLAPPLSISGCVHRDALSVLPPTEGGPVTNELDRVDRLAAAADEESQVLAVDPTEDLLVVLGDVDARVYVELVDDSLEDRANPLDGRGRQGCLPFRHVR